MIVSDEFNVWLSLWIPVAQSSWHLAGDLKDASSYPCTAGNTWVQVATKFIARQDEKHYLICAMCLQGYCSQTQYHKFGGFFLNGVKMQNNPHYQQ